MSIASGSTPVKAMIFAECIRFCKELEKMANTAITLEKPELFEIWDIPVCTSKYNYKEGSLTVKFIEDIMPYLAQVKKNLSSTT